MRTILFLIFLAIFFGATDSVYAYRPYITTEADVDDSGQWWLQMGVFELDKEGADTTITTPVIDLSYGFMERFDAGLTGNLQVYSNGNGRNTELTSTAVYVDYQIKNGVFQGAEGSSVMVELDLLLPQTVRGQRDVGMTGIFAASGKLSKLAYHLNASFNFDQIDFNPGFIWGAVLEYPFQGKFRIGIEFTGTTTYSQLPDNVGGIGCIWERSWGRFDFGARTGLSDAANDWTLTTGVSIGF